jgi:hypothetical protein
MAKDHIKELKEIQEESKKLIKTQKKFIDDFLNNPNISSKEKIQGLKTIKKSAINGLKINLNITQHTIELLEKNFKKLYLQNKLKDVKLIKDELDKFLKLESEITNQILILGGQR